MEFVQIPDYLVRHMSDGFGVILALQFDLRWYFWCEKMCEYAAGSVLIFTSARCGLRFNLHWVVNFKANSKTDKIKINRLENGVLHRCNISRHYFNIKCCSWLLILCYTRLHRPSLWNSSDWFVRYLNRSSKNWTSCVYSVEILFVYKKPLSDIYTIYTISKICFKINTCIWMEFFGHISFV